MRMGLRIRRRESRTFRPWDGNDAPEKFLLIRYHAIGDVALTLPSAAAIRRRFPASRIDYMTCRESAPMLRALNLFTDIIVIPAQTAPVTQTVLSFGAMIRTRGYDVVLDLQRNMSSRWVRRIASPQIWGEFDRFSPYPACERVQECLRQTGFTGLAPEFRLTIRDSIRRKASRMLEESGWKPGTELVVLNPAGLWPTRQWPTDKYARLAGLWNENAPTQFLFLGTERLRTRAREISTLLGQNVVDLTAKTTLGEALAILTMARIVMTEDSGLMHMAWAMGIPTLALLGSTHHLRSAPIGNHVRTLDSGDLPCRDCAAESCRFGDVHCLSRYTPEQVYSAAQRLLANVCPVGALP